MIPFEGDFYRDDRMFVLYVAPCRLDPSYAGMASTKIYHEHEYVQRDRANHPDADFLWCVVLYRNTDRYPATRVDHFRSRRPAEEFARRLEPETPLISLNGKPKSPAPTVDEWQDMKTKGAWRDYDYHEMHSAGGDNPTEIVLSDAPRLQSTEKSNRVSRRLLE